MASLLPSDAISAADTPARAAQLLLAALIEEIPSAGGALLLMDPHTGLFWTGAVTDLPAETCHPFFRVELDDASGHSLRRLASTGAGARALSLRAAPDDPMLTDVVTAFGYADELRAVCRDASLVWGGISLWRASGHYTEADEQLLDGVTDLVGRSLRDAVLRSLDNVPPGLSRGVVVVDDGRVVEASTEGTEFLAELKEPRLEEYRHLDHLLALAAKDPHFSTVLATDDGRWIGAHGTALGRGRVAVSLVSAMPTDLFGTRVAGAGLTPREVETTRLVCRGLSDSELARELGVSMHTARDHVKAVRRKLGVRSRGEVVALVFAEHYFQGFLQSAAVGHSDD